MRYVDDHHHHYDTMLREEMRQTVHDVRSLYAHYKSERWEHYMERIRIWVKDNYHNRGRLISPNEDPPKTISNLNTNNGRGNFLRNLRRRLLGSFIITERTLSRTNFTKNHKYTKCCTTIEKYAELSSSS